MRTLQLCELLFQMFTFPSQLLLLRQQLLLLRLHAVDALRSLLQDHHLGCLLIVCHLGDLVPQSEEAQLELVPPLAFQHVVSPSLVVVLRVIGRPGAGALAVAADLFEDSATAVIVILQPQSLDSRLLLSGGGMGSVVVLVGGDVAPLQHQRTVVSAL